MKGEDCYAKHWAFITQRQTPDGGWVKAKENVAKIDGAGEMLVMVLQDLEPIVGYRFGVTCSESVACTGG